jgi:hypothetical protein
MTDITSGKRGLLGTFMFYVTQIKIKTVPPDLLCPSRGPAVGKSKRGDIRRRVVFG